MKKFVFNFRKSKEKFYSRINFMSKKFLVYKFSDQNVLPFTIQVDVSWKNFAWTNVNFGPNHIGDFRVS